MLSRSNSARIFRFEDASHGSDRTPGKGHAHRRFRRILASEVFSVVGSQLTRLATPCGHKMAEPVASDNGIIPPCHVHHESYASPRRQAWSCAGVAEARLHKDQSSMDNDQALREHLRYLLDRGGAHLDFDTAVANLPVGLRGAKPEGVPHTPWRLVEHMRIAQRDLLEF